jgi:hypothetical protein
MTVYRGTCTITAPLDSVTCLPCRNTRKPRFSAPAPHPFDRCRLASAWLRQRPLRAGPNAYRNLPAFRQPRPHGIRREPPGCWREPPRESHLASSSPASCRTTRPTFVRLHKGDVVFHDGKLCARRRPASRGNRDSGHAWLIAPQ